MPNGKTKFREGDSHRPCALLVFPQSLAVIEGMVAYEHYLPGAGVWDGTKGVFAGRAERLRLSRPGKATLPSAPRTQEWMAAGGQFAR